MSNLGPQLFPDWEDSTLVGPDVLMSIALENPRSLHIETGSEGQSRTAVNPAYETGLVPPPVTPL